MPKTKLGLGPGHAEYPAYVSPKWVIIMWKIPRPGPNTKKLDTGARLLESNAPRGGPWPALSNPAGELGVAGREESGPQLRNEGL